MQISLTSAHRANRLTYERQHLDKEISDTLPKNSSKIHSKSGSLHRNLEVQQSCPLVVHH